MSLLITIVIGIVIIFFIAVVILIPFAAIKQGKIPKSKCPKCENDGKFYKSPMKCPMCKTKVYKHGDGTYRIQN